MLPLPQLQRRPEMPTQLAASVPIARLQWMLVHSTRCDCLPVCRRRPLWRIQKTMGRGWRPQAQPPCPCASSTVSFDALLRELAEPLAGWQQGIQGGRVWLGAVRCSWVNGGALADGLPGLSTGCTGQARLILAALAHACSQLPDQERP